jgi:carbon-monoxide dehydrogenase catalytic subunit
MSEFRTIDPAAIEMLERNKAANTGITTQFERYLQQSPQCKFGLTGVCCRICLQGPCRIIPNKGVDKGICGARDYTIVARNAARYMAGGASAHSDHGREVAHVLLAAAEGKAPGYRIKDSAKLKQVAVKIGVAVDGRSDVDIAKDVAIKALQDFGKIDEEPTTWLRTQINADRLRKYKKCRVITPAIDRSVVQLLHQTCVGTDADPVNIIFGGIQAALADLTGMALSTDLSDILFGTPEPIVTEANLGSLKIDAVNIAVNGHNPLLSEKIVDAAEELKAEAQAAGASWGVQILGICCTGNEVLMRRGVPTVTSYGTQELAIMTGAMDALIMDVQCIYPAMQELSRCYHTQMITTTHFSKVPGAAHVEFHPDTAEEAARTIVRMAIDRFKMRQPEKIHIPNYKHKVIGGFSYESLMELFGKAGDPNKPLKTLKDAFDAGEIKGFGTFAGCNNTRVVDKNSFITLATELAKKDILMFSTGCGAQAFSCLGLLNKDGLEKHAGPGLKKFFARLQANVSYELPLIFHCGSCVDNTRVQKLWTNLAEEFGCGIPQLPFVAMAPEAMSEKAVAIGTWVISQGIPVYVGSMPPLDGSALIWDIVTQIARDVFGGYFLLDPDVNKAVDQIYARIERRAWRLKVHEKAAAKYESGRMNLYEG